MAQTVRPFAASAAAMPGPSSHTDRGGNPDYPAATPTIAPAVDHRMTRSVLVIVRPDRVQVELNAQDALAIWRSPPSDTSP